MFCKHKQLASDWFHIKLILGDTIRLVLHHTGPLQVNNFLNKAVTYRQSAMAVTDPQAPPMMFVHICFSCHYNPICGTWNVFAETLPFGREHDEEQASRARPAYNPLDH